MWCHAVSAILAFLRASRWRKATKCKSLIGKLQSNLIIQRKRRESMVRQSRVDISHFLREGQLQKALRRAEQLYEDERRLSAYEHLERFCGCAMANIPDLGRQSDVRLLPDDVKVAMSSIIFAASRIGELPELQSVRHLFKERYGYEFDRENVELRPGNLVDAHVKSCLEVSSAPYKASPKTIRELANDTSATEEFPASPSFRGSSMQKKATSVVSNEKTIRRSTSSAVNRLKMLARGRLSLDGMMEKRKMARKVKSQHVHPNLPEYDDFVAKLKEFREQRTRSA